jgi:anti-anti-sigma regulatory factor
MARYVLCGKRIRVWRQSCWAYMWKTLLTWQSSSAKAALYGLKRRSSCAKPLSRKHTPIVVIDLSEVRIIEGSGLGMLLFLHRWTQGRDIRLKLFNPTNLVKYTLEHANPTSQFDFANLDEMVALLARSDKRYAAAA